MGGYVADAVTDVTQSGEPSFVHVAVCTGSDVDGGSVTMVDRLCINRAGVDLINGDMQICKQEEAAFSRTSELQSVQIADLQSSKENYQCATACLTAIVLLCVYAISRLGLK